MTSVQQMSSPTAIPIRGAVRGVERAAPRSPLWVRLGFWISIVIAIAAVVHRFFMLGAPSASPPQTAQLDDAFASHAALTLAHILPALAFVLLAPIAIFRKTPRRKAPRVAWAERLLYPVGAIVGLTAYAMSVYSIGGWTERSAILIFDSLFLFSLLRAFLYQQRGEDRLSRRWLLRSIVILLGIATARPVMGVFFATSRLTHLTPAQFFGIAMWIGFSTNAIAVELWLRRSNIA
jgi:hypothetical protein